MCCWLREHIGLNIMTGRDSRIIGSPVYIESHTQACARILNSLHEKSNSILAKNQLFEG